MIEDDQIVISVVESGYLFAELLHRDGRLHSGRLISALGYQLEELDQFRPHEVEPGDLLVDLFAHGGESFFLGQLKGFGFELGFLLGGRLGGRFCSWVEGDFLRWRGGGIGGVPGDGCIVAPFFWEFGAGSGVQVSVIWI